MQCSPVHTLFYVGEHCFDASEAIGQFPIHSIRMLRGTVERLIDATKMIFRFVPPRIEIRYPPNRDNNLGNKSEDKGNIDFPSQVPWFIGFHESMLFNLDPRRHLCRLATTARGRIRSRHPLRFRQAHWEMSLHLPWAAEWWPAVHGPQRVALPAAERGYANLSDELAARRYRSEMGSEQCGQPSLLY